MTDRLVIFDCYKTLVGEEAVAVANKSYRETVQELFPKENFPSILDVSRFDADDTATTSQEVIRQMARKAGVDQSSINSKEDVMLSTYENKFEKCANEGQIIVLPGVENLLGSLKINEIYFGIYTGDPFGTLRVLLEKSNLQKYFPEDMRSCGSNETPDRTKLLRLAIEKAERKYNIRFPKDHTFVIDDSWRGIMTAEFLGIKSIAVTGDPQRFLRYRTLPKYFFPELSDYKRVLDVILG